MLAAYPPGYGGNIRFKESKMMLYPMDESRAITEIAAAPLPAEAPVAVEGPETPRCAHYWIIEPASGPISRGVCQICMEARDFQNSVEAAESFVER